MPVVSKPLQLSGPELCPQQPEYAVIFLHGYGADGDDLIDLAYPLSQLLPAELHAKVAFFSPHAPDETAMGMGRQWFSDKNFTFKDKAGSARAKELLETYVTDYVGTEKGIAAEKVVLIGFSQGTMTALYAAPRFKKKIAGVVGFSGLLQWEEDLQQGAFHSLPTLLVHGADDDVVPADRTVEAAQKLEALGVSVAHHVLPNLAHGIDATGLTLAAHFIAAKFLAPAKN